VKPEQTTPEPAISPEPHPDPPRPTSSEAFVASTTDCGFASHLRRTSHPRMLACEERHRVLKFMQA
jgi:hypothetical protein